MSSHSEVEHIVRRANRGRMAFVIAFLALAGGIVYTIYVNTKQDTEITRVQHSACQAEPAGRECQKSKRESSRAASIATTCIPFFKAGYPCPKPGSTEAERQGRRQEVREGSSAPASGNSGEAPKPSNTGSHTTPAPHIGGSGGGTAPPKSGGGAGNKPSAQPSPSPSAGAPTHSESSSSTSSESKTETTREVVTEPSSSPGLVETVGGVVQKTGEAVGGTLEGVGELGCTLLCPKH